MENSSQNVVPPVARRHSCGQILAVNFIFWIVKIPLQYFLGGRESFFDPMWSLMEPRFLFIFYFLNSQQETHNGYFEIKLLFVVFQQPDFELDSPPDFDLRTQASCCKLKRLTVKSILKCIQG